MMNNPTTAESTCVERAKNMVSTFPYLMKVFHRLGAGAVSDLDITLPQYQTLAAFTVQASWRVSDLAEFLQVKPPAASELVDRLVKLELIQRETNPNDRRQTILTLSEKGKQIIEHRQEQMVATYTRILERLKPKEQKALEQSFLTLARIAKSFESGENGR